VTPLGSYIVQTLVTLTGVVALAVLILYAARRLGMGRAGGPLELVGRLPLDGRRAVYLVRVGRRVLVLGAGDQALTSLAELSAEEVSGLRAGAPEVSFRETLSRVLHSGRAETKSAPEEGDPGEK
jgi:flagellar protein FliO/FliZ